MVDLKATPFNLTGEQIKWVEDTKKEMTLEEKIGQLFFLAGFADPETIAKDVKKVKPGGIMMRPAPSKTVSEAHKLCNEVSKIPMFFAANLEAGADGLVSDGSHVGNEMIVAATNNPDFAYKMGEACMVEAKAVGGNMAFAPLIDLNFNWENPIANIRCFGDDVEKVSAMGRAYVKGVQDNGGSVTIKHFPGDGTDGRDQHVIKTYNHLSYEDWMDSFGRVYKDCIDDGATGLMVGHIALPSYMDKFFPNEDRMMPGSLNPFLLNNLLREELGFNGLVMTDATQMIGFGAEGKRCDLVPRSIAAGNDMFLFAKSLDEDYKYMMDGYKNGVITDERLDNALTRILGLKAHQGLMSFDNIVYDNFDLIGTHTDYQTQVADNAITLVKDDQKLLPLTPEKYKKLGVICLGNIEDMAEVMAAMGGPEAVKEAIANRPHTKFMKELSAQGFEVIEIDHSNIMSTFADMTCGVEEFKSRYDAIMYLVKKDTKSNQTNLRVQFKSFIGFDAPWFIHEVPTLVVSIANPYHGYDFEYVPTFINSYCSNDATIKLTIEKIMGKSEFKGVSPVKLEFEPFTGDISRWK